MPTSRALSSSFKGAWYLGHTWGQPWGSTMGVRGWFQGNLSEKKIVTDGQMPDRWRDGQTGAMPRLTKNNFADASTPQKTKEKEGMWNLKFEQTFQVRIWSRIPFCHWYIKNGFVCDFHCTNTGSPWFLQFQSLTVFEIF